MCRNIITIHEFMDPDDAQHFTETDKFVIKLTENEVNVGNIFEMS